MKITNDFGEVYEANHMQVKMVKTVLVNVDLDDLDSLGDGPDNEMSEEELEEIAHEDWLDAYAAILKMLSEKFPYIDLEGYSTDSVQMEVVE